MPVCKTVLEEKCKESLAGYTAEQKCDQWPREVCSVERRTVNKSSPQTGCDKIAKLMCAPTGCAMREVRHKIRVDSGQIL